MTLPTDNARMKIRRAKLERLVSSFGHSKFPLLEVGGTAFFFLSFS